MSQPIIFLGFRTEVTFLFSLSKTLYKIKRFGNSLFTYNCISCKKAVRGNCLCPSCLSECIASGNYFNGFACAFYYEGPAKETVLRFKFGTDYAFCFDTLCDWLLLGYEKLEDRDFDAVIPVPAFETKSTRLSELTKKFSLLADIPFRPDYLKKIRKTEKQHKLSVSERRLNLAGAFESSDSVFGKKVLLVDDIFTTGSTVTECASALYDKGAEKVCVLTVLKTRYHS